MTAVFAVLFAALCFATTGTAQALADVDGSALSIGAARVLVGGGLLGAIALVALLRRGRQQSSDRERRDGAVPSWVIVIVGALGVLAYQPTFFAGTRLNGVAVGTVIALGSAPVFTGVLNAVIRRSRPTSRWAVATAIALVGVVLVSGVAGNGSGQQIVPAGILASLGAGASYAVYAIASKLLLDRGWSTSASMGAVFGVAAVFSVPVLLSTSLAWIATPSGIVLVLWLGVVTIVVAYLLFGWGLKRLAPTTVASLTLAEPLVATLLGLIVLRETLSAPAVVGLIIMAVGLTILTLPARRKGLLRDTATP
ncbi:DMT family transporter [Agreia sp. Leaf283]|uniref:DMT family transporter n=1 Tax=Agreia sp. Leaf283 TaxID=1736321 RepID=UPI0006F284E7|nr:EamA family transporter [Agreia sp. Leaf283]KQP54123.1 multidrug transporter [Agreia sp. Leaf283]